MNHRLLAVGLILALPALTLSGAARTRIDTKAREVVGSPLPARLAFPSAYGQLPLAFVRNAGQVDQRVRYAGQAGGASFFFTQSGAIVALARGTHGVAVRLAFLGANRAPTITGAHRTTGVVNYLIGSDPARWHKNLPSYTEVVYRGLWPGVALRVRGRSGVLEYEFHVAPGADVSPIRLGYRGQQRLSLEGGGALRIQTALGVLRDTRPVSYQQIGGKRVAVESRFALGPGDAYGFEVGAYDHRYPLVIDPGLVYSTYLGGNGGYGDSGSAIAVDSVGNAYVTGSVGTTNFPTTAGAFDTSFNGFKYDAFVTKLNPSGSALVYSTLVGGGAIDRGWGIAVDGTGSAYVAGTTGSQNFPTTADAFDTTFDGGPLGSPFDAFVLKLNASGSGLVYSTFLGGSGYDRGGAIAVDGAGDSYVTGLTRSTGFPTTVGAFDPSLGGTEDAFVTQLNASGSALTYSTFLGGNASDQGHGIALDGAGNAYVTGSTSSPDLPTTAGAFDTIYAPERDAFVTKLNPSGSTLAYSTYLGGSINYGIEDGNAIAVDGAGTAYVTGSTSSPDLPTTAGAFDTSFNGGGDAFVTRLNAVGSALTYSTFLGKGANESGAAIAVDRTGSAHLTGFTTSSGFPTTAGAFDTSYNGQVGDAFVTKLNASGSALAYSTFLGGSSYDWGYGIAADTAGNAYVTGYTESANLPTTPHALDRIYNGHRASGDAFVTKFDLIAGPPVRCHVPRVIGMKLANAKRTIRTRHCSVGRIHRVRSKRVGRVLAQTPRAGTFHRIDFNVCLVVGRR